MTSHVSWEGRAPGQGFLLCVYNTTYAVLYHPSVAHILPLPPHCTNPTIFQDMANPD